jgi:archaellum biogenesis ATPase FlaH
MKTDVEPLEIMSAQSIIEASFDQPEWIVEGLLTCGLTLLVGSPKAGKSWLILGFLNQISLGNPVWGFATHQCGTLYLALEDVRERIQQRLWRITDVSSEDFHVATHSGTLGSGLLEQLDQYLSSFPNTKVIVIDTLTLVRDESSDSAYARDYKDLNALKGFADEHRIAMVVVHHTRKLASADVFATVSGTNGITGAADQTMVLVRASHATGEATLSITGRDTPDRELRLKFHDCVWELVGEVDAGELAERAVAPVVQMVADFMSHHPEGWRGTITDLMGQLPSCPEDNPTVVSKKLVEFSDFLESRGISCERKRAAHGTRLVSLTVVPQQGGDGGDAGDAPHAT